MTNGPTNTRPACLDRYALTARTRRAPAAARGVFTAGWSRGTLDNLDPSTGGKPGVVLPARSVMAL